MQRRVVIFLIVVFGFCLSALDSNIDRAQAAPEIQTGLWDNYGPGTPNFPTGVGITAIVHDGQGRPWMATNGAGIVVFQDDRWIRHTTSDGLASNNVRNLLAQGETIWAATANGVSHYDGTSWTTVGGVPSTDIRAIAYRSGFPGTYLIGTASGLAECGLFFPLSFSCQFFTTSNSDLPDNLIVDLATTSDDVRWIVTGSGVARITGSSTWTVFSNGNTSGCPIISYTVRIAADDRNDRVWFGTSRLGEIDRLPGEGACMFEATGSIWHLFDSSNSGLGTNTVADIAIDPDGRAWLATDPSERAGPGGVYVCTWVNDLCYWAHYTENNSELPRNTLTAVGADLERVWFGTRFVDVGVNETYAASLALPWQTLGGGDVYALDYISDEIWAATDNGVRHYNGVSWATELTGVQVRAILTLADNDIWAGVIGGGVWHWDGGWRQFNSANSGLAGDNVRAITQDTRGRLWFGTWSDGVSVYDPSANAWTTFNTENVLPNNRVQAASLDSLGRVWLGTDGGVVRYDGTAWITFTTTDGLPDDIVQALAEDDNGLIWAGTPSGAAYWDGVGWTTVVDPLPHPNVRAIHVSGGLVWLGSARGAVSFDGTTYTAYRARNSGLLNQRLRAITSDNEGGIHFGSASYTANVGDIAGGVFYRQPLSEPLGAPAPQITSFDPLIAPKDELITVTGARFVPGDRIEFSTKSISGWVIAFNTQWINEETLQVRVPGSAITGPIRVRGKGGVATSDDEFTPLPRITGLSKQTGMPGSPLRIYGSNLEDIGFSEVRFGDSAWNSLIVEEQDWYGLDVIVPADATTGPVRVRTQGGTHQSADDFVVASGSLQLLGYEIHQGLPGLTLVAGKSAVVRLYLGSSNENVCAYATRAAVQLLDPNGGLTVFAGTEDNGGVPQYGEFCNTQIDYSDAGSITVIIPGQYLVAGLHRLGVIVKNGWVDLITQDIGAAFFVETGSARLFFSVPDWENASADELALFDRQMANLARALPVRDGVGDLGSGKGVEYYVQDHAICDGSEDIPGCGEGGLWDFWQGNTAGQEQACVLINNLTDGSDDGDVMTFKYNNLKANNEKRFFFFARQQPGVTLPTDLRDLIDVTVSPSSLTLKDQNVTRSAAGDDKVNCGPVDLEDIVLIDVLVANDTDENKDINLEVNYDQSIVNTYGPGAILLGQGNEIQTQTIPGVFFSASGWGGNKFGMPHDENYDGDIDAADLAYYVQEIEDWNAQTGEFERSGDLNAAGPGDLIRMFADQNGNGRRDSGEPKASIWRRTDNADKVLYGLPAGQMRTYNDANADGVDAEYSGLLFFKRINPSMGPGRESGERFWADIDTSTTIAHEFGHALGLVASNSVNSNGGSHSKNVRVPSISAGYNFISMTAVISNGLRSIMWPNIQSPVEQGFYEPAEYLDLVDLFWRKGGQQNQAVSRAVNETPHFYIAGVLYDDNTISVNRSLLSDNHVPTDADTDSPYRLRFTGSGQPLGEFGIPVDFYAYDPLDRDRLVYTGASSFSIMQPFPAAADSVEIWHGDTRIWQQTRSANPPSVQVIAPTAGANYGATDQMTINWTGFDPDGDTLWYSVRYSPDGGTTWRVLAVDETGTSVTVPLSVQPGGDQGIVEVEASDGFHTATARSNGTFSVGAKDPLWASIHAPSAAQAFVQGRPIWFEGSAYDLEDGVLSGVALRWFSDRDGEIGSGSLCTATLTVGTHTITLRAIDSQNGQIERTAGVVILPDFDGDGLADAYEQQYSQLSPWNAADAAQDSDGDGLVNRAEAEWGTHPGQQDTDGDGIFDGAEVSGGSLPTDATSMPAEPGLVLSHTTLTFQADADTTQLERRIFLANRTPSSLAWQATDDADWLTFDTTAGGTPTSLTVRVDASALGDGRHTATITFISNSGELTALVEVIKGEALPDLYLPLIVR